MRMRWAVALTVALAALLSSGAGAASATDPVTLGTGHVLDDAGALNSAQTAATVSRIQQLKTDTGLDLWVVYVDAFTNPGESGAWANSVAEKNGLGRTQYLLAIAVGSRQYYLSGSDQGPVTSAQLDTIEQQQIQPRLANNDWAGAVSAAADGLTDAKGGGSGAGSGSKGIGFGGILIVVCLILIVAVVGYLIVRATRKRSAAGQTGRPSLPPVDTKELAKQASSALVQTDDAVKTSDQELGFARAQFGDAATTEFEAALGTARGNLDQAFSLKQQLDDDVPDTEEQVRAWNQQILQLCAEANQGLDEKSAAFDELRGLEKNAPAALARTREERGVAADALDSAATRLQTLQASYAPEALATVADNVGQANQRIAFADERIAAAETAIAAGNAGEAAVSIRAAEDAVGQAKLLEDAIDKLGSDLAAAEQSAAALMTDLESDVAGATALPDQDGQVAAAIVAVRQQLDAARADLAGTRRVPLATLQSLEAVNQQIDTVVQGVRDAAAEAQRSAQMLGQQMLQAQGQVSAAEDYITARRGAVGAEARTRLAQAGAELVQAQQLHSTDPAQAVPHAQRANQLAAEALNAAQNDVGAFGSSGSGGLFGGGGGGGDGTFGAILGGIVINSLLSGGGNSRSSSSRPSSRRTSGGSIFGGGGSGSSGGGLSSGSFGGGGTRARRGGGRF